jgi:YHS domain-containing protein
MTINATQYNGAENTSLNAEVHLMSSARRNNVNGTVTDPICKMEVDLATTRYSSLYKGRTYYFCAPGCKAIFDQNPAKYVRRIDHNAGHSHGCCGGQ